MGSWSTDRNHVRDSFPSPNSTSATPCPSVPGSHAATNASMSPRYGSTTSGRPEMSTTTHLVTLHTDWITLGPGAGIVRFRLSPNSYLSASTVLSGLSEYTTCVLGSTVALIPERIVVPVPFHRIRSYRELLFYCLRITSPRPSRWKRRRHSPMVLLLPLSPCQVMVQPPHWLPKLSAWLPATRILPAFFGSGSNGADEDLPFFSSTRDFLTASRARSRYGVVDSAHGNDLVLNLCGKVVDEFCSPWRPKSEQMLVEQGHCLRHSVRYLPNTTAITT
ncbi:hypothetical protein U9M48_010563 [Paspalum notatum var. saurae]|uniref:Uncharacterized protein n=1 Tax=Paspalum notatum var. saurae TaxID=547442 RepID=A0AAQ3SV09_PASNO